MSWAGLGFSRFIGLDYFEFVNYLKDCYERRGYWKQNPASREYKLSSLKESFEALEKSFQRLTFREITLLGYAFKFKLQGDYENAQLVLLVFKYMHSHKIANQQKTRFPLNTLNALWDCCLNKLEGHGFTSTAHIALNVITDLEKVPQPVSPLFIELPSSPTNPRRFEKIENIEAVEVTRTAQMAEPLVSKENKKEEIAVKPVLKPLNSFSQKQSEEKKLRRVVSTSFGDRRRLYEQTAQSTGKLAFSSQVPPSARMSLEKYKNGYETCTDLDKLWIVNNITKIKSPSKPDLNCKKPIYLTDLLCVLCQSMEYDLNDQACVHIILDMFYFKTESEQDRLAEWLKEEGLKENQTFSASLLKQILETLRKRRLDKGSVSFYAISVLVTFYQLQINTPHNTASNAAFPYEPEILEIAMSLMFIIQPNNDATLKLAKWLSERGNFISDNFPQLKETIEQGCQINISGSILP